MFGLEKDTFKLRVNIETTGDVCILRGIKKELKVTELKEKIEGIIGIPSYLLQVFYLDDCALEDRKTLAHFHVLPDARIKVRVWKTNQQLVIASRNGNWRGVERELRDYSTPEKEQPIANDRDRPLSALFIACFHGNEELLEMLLEDGVNPRRILPSGRHALSVAATRGHMRCVELLLGRKVRPYEWSHQRSSLTNWDVQDRIKASLQRIEKRAPPVSDHIVYTRLTNSQKYDSRLSTWYNGDKGQLYLCEILDNSLHKARK